MAEGILLAHDLTPRCAPVSAAASQLATRLGAPLSVLHVLSSDELEQKRANRDPNAAFTDVIVKELTDELRDIVIREASDAGVRPTSSQVLIGDPHGAIVEHLEQRAYDFVFLGVRNRSRVGKLLFGSVAQSVLLGSPTKVVCVPIGE